MSYGVISGLGPVAGLYGSIAVCPFAAVFDGAGALVSGPNIFGAIIVAIVSHGLGNVAAGLIGSMPGSVSSTSFSNADKGGRTVVSSVLAGSVLLLLAVGLRKAGESIPYAVLSGVVIYTAWNVMEWRFLGRIHRIPRLYVFVTLLTIIVALFVDFASAILIGLVASALTRARNLEGLEIAHLASTPILDRMALGDEQADDDPFEARSVLVVFPDRVSVASARELTRIAGQDVDGHDIVVFDLSRTIYVDDTAASLIGRLVSTVASQKSRRFVIVGLHGDAERLLRSMNPLNAVPQANFAADMDEAIQIVRTMFLDGVNDQQPTEH